MGPRVSETDADLFQRMRSTADAHLCAEPRRRRLDGWEKRLAEFIAARMDDPFVWGVSDCCLFACDAIKAMRGDDPAAWFRGRYDDMRGAAAALREFSEGGGLEDVAERIAREQGFDEISPAFAQRGDCLLIATDGGSALGVQFDHRAAVQGPARLTITMDVRVLRAWAV